MTHGTRQTQASVVPGPAEDGSRQPPSASLPGHRENFGRLLAHLTPCLGHAFLTPLEQLLAGTSAIVSELSRCLGVGSSNLDLYQGQETLKRKAEGLVLPACLWKGPCGPPSCGHNADVYTGAWLDQPVGFQERCSPIPWAWSVL